MAKKPPADLRTIDMFSGKTKQEELVEQLPEEEEKTEKMGDTRSLTEQAVDLAGRWLGLDTFHEGDDISIAVHPKGHAVLTLIATYGPEKVPYGTTVVKLSRAQWVKLKSLVVLEM